MINWLKILVWAWETGIDSHQFWRIATLELEWVVEFSLANFTQIRSGIG